MGPLLRWSWLLGVALVAPAAMPAGGAERRQPQVQVRRRQGSGPLHTSTETMLRLSPMTVAPALTPLPAGTSLRLLRRWCCDEGGEWCYVQPLAEDQPRGWIRA